ncbi:MAG: cytochrome c maturation protein CcmE [Leptospiraceae bacterium]|nr:cytochrome c maturation protein CcmE [Leptospiraceae bacterium]MDW7976764.1 cytochrome c maturation protein CcmE [Leptospiraceae bacterium]
MNKKIFFILVSLIALVLSLFFINPDTSQTLLIVDADYVVDNKASLYNKELRIRGFVKPGSILRMGNKAEFIVTHNNKEVLVYFNGKTQIPDTFGDAAPVRIDGRLQPDGRFVAYKIEAKCASKYEAPSYTSTLPQNTKNL